MISAPINGPVQEKETITVVRAMKNAPVKPPWSAFASVLFTRLLGRTISNIPKNESANIKKRIKNSRLGIQCVLRQRPGIGTKNPEREEGSQQRKDKYDRQAEKERGTDSFRPVLATAHKEGNCHWDHWKHAGGQYGSQSGKERY
jgi:hypothetical protein